MINEGDEAFAYERGDRIAQLVVVPFAEQHFEVVDELPDSDRGEAASAPQGPRR